MLVRTLFRPIGICALVAALIVCAGCGTSDGPRRVAMFGTVTLDGAPLASGSISLLPSPGHEAPAANTMILQGEYHFDRANGPTVGEYEILIMQGSTGEPSSKAVSFQSAGPRRQEWKLPVNIPAAKDFEHDIPLETARASSN